MFMVLFLVLLIVAIVIGIGCYMSKRKFDNRISELVLKPQKDVNSNSLQSEIDRIKELKCNLREIRENVEKLDIPTPESVSSYDNVQSTLNKLSRFFEEHNSATVGTEQMILSILPSQQLRESLHSLARIVPPDIGQQIFGDAFSSLKDGVSSFGTAEFLHRFVEGSLNLSDMAIISMKKAIIQHDVLGACLTPIKSGAMEAFGIHDATHNIVNSLHDVSNEMISSATTNVDIESLLSATDVDIAGHVPVITIALSSFREFDLLFNDKTDYISSLKNILLDVAGAGAGAAIGTKIGLTIGTSLGPIGALFGGLFGGAIGAMIGRKITNEIKLEPLKKAVSEYESQYHQMKFETGRESRSTAHNIQSYAEDKRKEFHNSPILEDIPITETNQVISQIALILYQFEVNELMEMKTKSVELRKSIWCSLGKYNRILTSFEEEIKDLEEQIPPEDFIKDRPETAIEILLNMPKRKTAKAYQEKINECCEELKVLNDKNHSSVLIWSYMVNNLYQKTLNDIANYSNMQMESLNKFFNGWKNTMAHLEDKINVEKGKLGLS